MPCTIREINHIKFSEPSTTQVYRNQGAADIENSGNNDTSLQINHSVESKTNFIWPYFGILLLWNIQSSKKLSAFVEKESIKVTINESKMCGKQVL